MSKRDTGDNEEKYMGNIWGWKISWMSLVLIVFMLGLMAARKCYLDNHPEEQIELNQTD